MKRELVVYDVKGTHPNPYDGGKLTNINYLF